MYHFYACNEMQHKRDGKYQKTLHKRMSASACDVAKTFMSKVEFLACLDEIGKERSKFNAKNMGKAMDSSSTSSINYRGVDAMRAIDKDIHGHSMMASPTTIKRFGTCLQDGAAKVIKHDSVMNGAGWVLSTEHVLGLAIDSLGLQPGVEYEISGTADGATATSHQQFSAAGTSTYDQEA
jgi:hypothetical protein